jgi:hypothetical protein
MQIRKRTKVAAPHEAGAAAIEEVIKDPTVRFDSPAAVLIDPALTGKQKEAILSSWVKDAELLSEAENENMGGGERSRLQEANVALETLPHPARGKKPA